MTLCCLAPLLVVIGTAIKLDSRGPVIFTQERIGRHGKPFRVLKFRTMLTFESSFQADGTPLSNSERVTHLGRLLRRSSLDELPQLINVLKGEMSIVGPRPTLPYQVEKYTTEQHRRLDVSPGLTGLAQVSGRNSLTWTQKIDLDIDYVDSLSLTLDIRILLRTIRTLFADDTQFKMPDEISHHSKDAIFDVGYEPGSQASLDWPS